MQTARGDLKLSQKDVAQKVNEKPSIIQDYESGKAIPNAQILGKLERVLGVKLRGRCPSHHNIETKTLMINVLFRCRHRKEIRDYEESIKSASIFAHL